MSFLKLLPVLFVNGASIVVIVVDYANISAFRKVVLLGNVVAYLLVVFDHYRHYRKGKLFKAEIEETAARITDWLVDNRAEFELSGISEHSLARAAKISAEQAAAAIDRLENREAVVRDPIALTNPPRFLLKPGRNWTPTRDKLATSRVPGTRSKKMEPAPTEAPASISTTRQEPERRAGR